MKYDPSKIDAVLDAINRRVTNLDIQIVRYVTEGNFRRPYPAAISARIQRLSDFSDLILDCRALIKFGADPTGEQPAGRMAIAAA